MDSLPTPTRLPSRRSWLWTQLVAGLLIGVLTLGWAVRGLDLRLVLQSLVTARYAWVLVSLVGVIGVALTKAARWKALYVVSERQTTFGEIFSALIISQMVNVVIPIRIGELVRIGLMKQSGQPGATTLSTIIVEKTLDLVAIGAMAFSLVMLAVMPVWLRERTIGLLPVGLALVTGLVLVWWRRDWLERFLARALALGGWLPERWQARLLRVTRAMFDALGTLTDLRALARVLFWTTLTWLLSLLAMLILFTAFGLTLPIAAGVVLLLALSFSYIVPAPPAMIGVMHAITVVVLGWYGVPQTAALGFGIVLNVVTVAPLIMLGGLALWQRTLSSIFLLRGQPLCGLWRKL